MSLTRLKACSRLIIAALIASSASFSTFTYAAPKEVSCRVVGIKDGDTLLCLLPKNKELSVRLGMIDAPEKAQDFGTRAKQALSDKIFNKTVKLVITGKSYDREVAHVFYQDRHINLEMVADGFAWVSTRYAKPPYRDELEAAQRTAREKGLGLWRHPEPIEPWLWRKGQRQTSEVTLPIVEVVACTMDARQCPDGSYVARTLPSCQFAPCK